MSQTETEQATCSRIFLRGTDTAFIVACSPDFVTDCVLDALADDIRFLSFRGGDGCADVSLDPREIAAVMPHTVEDD